MNKKVAILMSTYNGERYLEEQIRSIINQSYHNWVLYIRDDGSIDNTQGIIRKYAKQSDQVIFFNEGHVENVGVVRSFMTLLKDTNADYYMFSDQDDFWLKDKVKDTVERAEVNEPGPVCVFTDLESVNQNLQPLQRVNGDNVWTDFRLLLFANCVTGCTMLVNEALKKLIKFDKIDYNQIYMHDWWIALIAAAQGKLVYLNEPTIQYRQHGDNVVGSAKKNTLGHIIYRISHWEPERKYAQAVINMISEYQREYPYSSPVGDRYYVEEYAKLKTRSSFFYNLRLFLRLRPPRQNVGQTVFFGWLMVRYPQDFLEN